MTKLRRPKSYKGKVVVSNDRKTLRLRWSFQGKKYEFRPGLRDTPDNRCFAERIAKDIEVDMKAGYFDTTLNKYRSRVNLPPESPAPKKKVISAIALFDKYFEFRRSDLALGTQKKYEALRSQLYQELGESSAELDIDTILRFKNWLSDNFASVTSKDKIAILKAVWRWGIHRNLVKSNPWTEVKFKKEIKKKSEPLTLEESKRIIAEFRESRPFYADLVEFKLLTGVRTGEAFALQWGDFNESLTQLTIYKSFNSSTKELKPVKQEDIRRIDFAPRVTRLLLRRREQAITKDKKNISKQLVFPNTEGGYMIARNFSKRHWRPVLTKLGIDYRRPYDTRKTLVSHAIEQGMSPVDVAKYVGNTPKTIYESYLGSVKKIIPPDFLNDDFS